MQKWLDSRRIDAVLANRLGLTVDKATPRLPQAGGGEGHSPGACRHVWWHLLSGGPCPRPA
eukprot:14817482-Alexandrium_andersonii.AAC.1